MKQYALLMLLICVAIISSAQNKKELVFSAELKKGSSDNILLSVKNLSSKTYYYLIGAQGVVDTGYVAILSDIKSIGTKGFLKLVPIEPNSEFTKIISKKSIIKQCYCSGVKKIRFYLSYFTEENFEAENKVIKVCPL